LSEFGHDEIPMPATPAVVWGYIHHIDEASNEF